MTLLTALVLVCFAANSLLCRLALRPGLIDPASFSALRIAAGAVTLMLLMRVTSRKGPLTAGNWPSAACLVGYALCFSLAYMQLDTGIGALILFGVVQAGMIGWGMARGARPNVREWFGLITALAGLGLLTLRGQDAPGIAAAMLMAAAGVFWAAYTLRGRRPGDPVAATAGNFLRGVPIVVMGAVLLMMTDDFSWRMQPAGAGLAVLSGSVTSGLGYALWYRVLPRLRTSTAAILQLTVPVIATVMGMVILDEALSARTAAAGALILGGVALGVVKLRA